MICNTRTDLILRWLLKSWPYFCLRLIFDDLKERLSKWLLSLLTTMERLLRAGDLEAAGAMALLLKDAVSNSGSDALDNTPAFIHGDRLHALMAATP